MPWRLPHPRVTPDRPETPKIGTLISGHPTFGPLLGSQLPGADDTTPLIAVARGGVTASGVRGVEPGELISAWR